MAKKEFKVGEVFRFDCNIKLKVEKSTKNCIGCYFRCKECVYDCMDDKVIEETGDCLSSGRSDKTSVIFVKV